MVVETGYQMPASAVEHLLIVVIFSIVYIFTRDVPYYDHRCVISNAPPLAPSSPSVSPPTPPRGRDKMDGTHICTARELMRWLTALLCFVDAKYDTLEKGNCTAAAKKIIDTGYKQHNVFEISRSLCLFSLKFSINEIQAI